MIDSLASAQQDRLLVVSVDCHAGPPTMAGYREYLDATERDSFDEYLAAIDTYEAELAARKPPTMDAALLSRGVESGLWDIDERTRQLDADGIAAEVIFPQGSLPFAPYPPLPMTNGLTFRYQTNAGLRNRGVRAYNRWLAELCGNNPVRHAGVASVPIRDVPAAVTEVQRARKAGLSGGISLPAVAEDFPKYNDPVYEPLWAACEEFDMPINAHGGSEGRNYGSGPEARAVALSETDFYSRRSLSFLIFSGVFERHPRLRLVFTEQRAHWVPFVLDELDSIYESNLANVRHVLPRRPSEYFFDHCYIGGSFLSPRECELRSFMPVEHMMWGSDYPHLEGTWPFTSESLRWTFTGVPHGDVARIIGQNAISCYGFDGHALQHTAARVGPTIGQIDERLDAAPVGAELSWAFRSGPWS